MTEITKTFEILDADQDALIRFEKAVKRKGVSVYQVKDRVLFAISDDAESNQKIIQEAESYAFDLGVDYTKVKLVYLNAKEGILDDSQSAILNFAKENHIEETANGMPLSLLPDLIEFVQENKGGIAEEEKQLSKNEKIEVVQTEEEEFIDDVAMSENNTSFAPTPEVESEKEEELIGESSSPSEEGESAIQELEKEEVEQQENENESGDYLMEKAKALFETSAYIRLPVFDELTHKKLHEQVLQAQFAIAAAKGESIQAIYNRLKTECAESVEQIEVAMMKNARNAHEDALNRIDKNLNLDIHQLLTERDAEYEQNRERYIQAQIPIIKKQYDAEHYGEHEKALEAEMEMLRRRSAEEKTEEKARFSSYVEKVFADSKENVMNTIHVDDIIKNYNAVAKEQREVLQLQAKSVQSEIGTTVTEIVKERDELKEEIARYEAQIDKQVTQEKERVQQEVNQTYAEKEKALMQQNKAKLDESYANEQELLRQIEVLEQSLAEEKEDKKLIERKLIEPTQTSVSGEKEKEKTSLFGKGDGKLSRAGLIASAIMTVILVAGAATGIAGVYGVKAEVATNNQLQRAIYLEQLQGDKKYTKAANVMNDLGYSKKEVAKMYLENGKYMNALKKDSSIASEFYTYVDKQTSEKQKQILEEVKKAEVLGGKQENALDVRLAILNQDDKALEKLLQDTTDQTAKVATKYYISEKKYTEAEQLLKKHHDAKLSKEVEKAQSENAKTQIESLQKDIEALNQKIDDATKKDISLKQQLAAIKKAKGDAAKINAKQKQITDNAKQKTNLEQSLKEKQEQKEELEKDL
ncbi:hypothetical protein [Listeria sp. ILCC797]|uniref:hypothetical protein n=1 Tax=Listeria sp. ILCC797 TaxID=1918333 RepID=UPI000B58F3EE|nr:hypothetical protein [Listeria sp. ILCC797]